MKLRLVLLLAGCGLACAAAAAKSAAAPDENPAIDTLKEKPADGYGTTIMGERDSDVGLFLTPWKEEHADNIDPPPGLLDVQPQTIDAHGFARQVREAATLSAYRREQLQPNR